MIWSWPPGSERMYSLSQTAFGLLLAEFIGEGEEFLLGDLGGDAGGEAAPHFDAAAVGVGQGGVAFDEVTDLGDRNPDVGMGVAEGDEIGGEDAGDGGRLSG